METGVFLFRPEYQTILKVFDGSNRYSVPDFQRQYSWEAEQIEDLFDDVYGAFQRRDSYYFLGSIILTGSNDGSYEVIDGQQRLTTLTILFCVLRDAYFPNDNKIVNRIRNLENSQYRLSFLTHLENQNDFFQNIQKDSSLLSILDESKTKSDDYDSRFIKAAITLNSKLRETKWPSGKDTIKEFVDYLLGSVGLITIICSDKKGAVRLFRTLNNRGLDLTTSDLVKSYLYDEATDPKERGIIIEEWKKIEHNISDTEDEDPDEMLTCFSYYLLESYQKEAIYDRLEEKFDEIRKVKRAEDIVFDIRKFSEIYKGIYFSKIKEVLSMWYLPNRLYWTSILATANSWTNEEYAELCKSIRNTFYIYWIAGFTSTKLKQLTFDIIKAVKAKQGIEVVKNLIKKKITDDEVMRIANERLTRDSDEGKWIKPLLMVVEYSRTDESKVDFVEMDRHLQLEHVLPTEWENNKVWKSEWSKTDANNWLHKIGNLTLLLGRKNGSAGNEAFDVKKEIYLGKRKSKGVTPFLLTQEIINEPSWTAEAVNNRQEALIQEVKNELEIS